MPHFDKFIGIDWSGAKGSKQGGLQIAVAGPDNDAPKLISPNEGNLWGRDDVFLWLSETIKSERALIGFDFAFGYPHHDLGCYFPGMNKDPAHIFGLWELIDKTCKEASNFYGGSFYKRKELPFHKYFLSPYGKGELYFPRKRITELFCKKVTAPHPTMKCIGPANVGTGSLAGMRFLHKLKKSLDKEIEIWPCEKKRGRSVAVEIFPRLYFKQSGTNPQNWQDQEMINNALKYFDSKPIQQDWIPKREDEPDALVSAAALRSLASNPAMWSAPDDYSSEVNLEGWIFGVT
jgi:hypothetical protein